MVSRTTANALPLTPSNEGKSKSNTWLRMEPQVSVCPHALLRGTLLYRMIKRSGSAFMTADDQSIACPPSCVDYVSTSDRTVSPLLALSLA